eukprot:57112-Eustigmatos_ZCMA.PRE.2
MSTPRQRQRGGQGASDLWAQPKACPAASLEVNRGPLSPSYGRRRDLMLLLRWTAQCADGQQHPGEP